MDLACYNGIFCVADLLGKNENDTTKCDVVVCCIDDVKMGMMEIFRAKEDEKVNKCTPTRTQSCPVVHEHVMYS